VRHAYYILVGAFTSGMAIWISTMHAVPGIAVVCMSFGGGTLIGREVADIIKEHRK
jgi:hypothetical protein